MNFLARVATTIRPGGYAVLNSDFDFRHGSTLCSDLLFADLFRPRILSTNETASTTLFANSFRARVRARARDEQQIYFAPLDDGKTNAKMPTTPTK
jgi:hypothetical protein